MPVKQALLYTESPTGVSRSSGEESNQSPACSPINEIRSTAPFDARRVGSGNLDEEPLPKQIVELRPRTLGPAQ